MKKFYFLMACACVAVAANAQNVKFYHGNQEIAKGSTFTVDEVEESEGFGGYLLHPDVTLKATNNTTVTVTAQCTTGQDIQLCFAGDCVPGVTATSPVVTLVAGASYDLAYKYESFDPITYEVTSKITVNDDITGAEVNSIFISYNPNSNGVSIVNDDNNGIEYKNGLLTYNTESAINFALYNASGQRVIKAGVSGAGEFPTANLVPGVYIYMLGDKTGKIYVK
ncbi:MAG: T9SS type A sorting domain-containing protein [Bacteroides sp.]|nr:T9SS type A sorting domain-containing protein [Bacteroides sp.]